LANPWLSIPLTDYEGHMSDTSVQQLTALSELFQLALNHCRPESVAILGIAGGNGVERVDTAITKRIVGVDLNPAYLQTVRQRFSPDSGPLLELHCVDLARGELRLPPVSLVHAALIFEHAGLGRALENALALVRPGGYLSVVLQLPSEQTAGVAATAYASMQTLKDGFQFIEKQELQLLLNGNGAVLVEQITRPLPGGKGLWFGIFCTPAA
jgi:SAM-dependent methyltransferase